MNTSQKTISENQEGDVEKAASNKREILLISHIGTSDNKYKKGREHGKEWLGQIKPELSAIIGGVRKKINETVKVVVLDYGMGEIGELTDTLSGSEILAGAEIIRLKPNHELEELEKAHIVIVLGGHNARVGANLSGLKNSDGSFVDTRKDASQHSLAETIRSRVQSGDLKYIGMSAGAIAAGASLEHASEEGLPKNYRTGNDVPSIAEGDLAYTSPTGKIESALNIVDTLDLLPFSVAAHFPKSGSKDFEDRVKKLQAIVDLTNIPIVAIGDDAAVIVEGDKFIVRGKGGENGHVYLFKAGLAPKPLNIDDEFSSSVNPGQEQ